MNHRKSALIRICAAFIGNSCLQELFYIQCTSVFLHTLEQLRECPYATMNDNLILVQFFSFRVERRTNKVEYFAKESIQVSLDIHSLVLDNRIKTSLICLPGCLSVCLTPLVDEGTIIGGTSINQGGI